MTNTQRKTTSTTAKIAAVGAFGIGAAIAFPGMAAAQTDPAPTPDTGTLENIFGDEGSVGDVTAEDGSLADLTSEEGPLADLPGGEASVEALLETDLSVDVGSLTLDLQLDAEAPNPGSVELGSLGVSPNTGSALIDGDDSGSGSGSGSAEGDTTTDADTGTLSASLAGLGSESENDTTD